MALPSKESLPRAGRATRFAAPVPPLNVPVARSSVTPVVFSGSISSYTRPPFGPPPASSANRIVPQGVRRDGSQPVVPDAADQRDCADRGDERDKSSLQGGSSLHRARPPSPRQPPRRSPIDLAGDWQACGAQFDLV